MAEVFLVLSIVVPLLGSFVCLILPQRVRGWWAVAVISAAFLFSLFLLGPILSGVRPTVKLFPPVNNFFQLSFLGDGISLIFSLVFAFIGLIALIYSLAYMRDEENQREYYFMTTLMIASLIGVVFSNNLILFYIFWEIAALTTWRLIGFYREKQVVMIADKAFLMTFLGSSFMLMGFVLLFQNTGTLSLAQLRGTEVTHLNTALFFIFLGIVAKSAILPLHTWLPDAHPVAPSPMSAILSGIEVEVGLYAFLRLFGDTFGIFWNWILILAVVSSLIGAGAALLAKDIKRIIAYSTVSQVGYILIGFALLNQIGLVAGLLYYITHALGKAGLFLGAGAVERKFKERDITRLGGLIKTAPALGIGFLFCSFSIMGLPPFGGFYAKLMVIMAAVETGHFWIATLAIVAAILTMLYLFRLFNGIFLGQARISGKGTISKVMVGCVVLLGIISLAIGLFMGQVSTLPSIAASQIFK